MNGLPTPGLRTITGQAHQVREELDKLAALYPEMTLAFTRQNIGKDGQGVECVHIVLRLVPKLTVAQK